MRAIKIDPYVRTITEIEMEPITKSLKPLYTAMGHGVDLVERSTWTLNNATIWLDENGLMNNHPYFMINGRMGWETFTGPAIITGGAAFSRLYPLQYIKDRVKFLSN